jgi:hypothetical protein
MVLQFSTEEKEPSSQFAVICYGAGDSTIHSAWGETDRCYARAKPSGGADFGHSILDNVIPPINMLDTCEEPRMSAKDLPSI